MGVLLGPVWAVWKKFHEIKIILISWNFQIFVLCGGLCSGASGGCGPLARSGLSWLSCPVAWACVVAQWAVVAVLPVVGVLELQKKNSMNSE